MPDINGVIGGGSLSGKVGGKKSLSGDIQASSTNVSNDHNLAINRDLSNQHPITAITGLSDELTRRYDNAYMSGEYLILKRGNRETRLGPFKNEGMSEAVKIALLRIFEIIAYADENAQSYYDDLYNAMYPPIGTFQIVYLLAGCSSSNTDSTIQENTGYYSSITVNQGYTLNGAVSRIVMGGTDITEWAYDNGSISIPDVTGDITISVAAQARVVDSISATFTQGTKVIFETDSLDTLRQNLEVTASYADGGTETVTDYTLSGTLEEGTSVITASFGGKTDTFDVTVTVYSTKAIIMQENVVWNANNAGPLNAPGFGITQWYPYEFTQEQLEACHYWNSTNEYMGTAGWAGIRICTPDYLTYQSGRSWPASNKFKHQLGRDGTLTNFMSISRNTDNTFNFPRQSKAVLTTNGFSASIPLADIDYCFAYWVKPQTYSIVPNGVSVGDIIFAGKYTPYYNLTNISEAPALEDITANFVQDDAIVTTASTLSSLKPMLSVTAQYDDGQELPANLGYVALTGELTEGVSTITATYRGKSTTFEVTVTASEE